MITPSRDGVGARRRFGNDDHIGLAANDCGQAFANGHMIVRNQDTDPGWRSDGRRLSHTVSILPGSRAGRITTIEVPSPSALRTVSWPPIACTRSLMPNSPYPWPIREG